MVTNQESHYPNSNSEVQELPVNDPDHESAVDENSYTLQDQKRVNSDDDTVAASHDQILDRLEEQSALFILELKNRHKLTQAATQGLIEGSTNLIQVQLQCN